MDEFEGSTGENTIILVLQRVFDTRSAKTDLVGICGSQSKKNDTCEKGVCGLMGSTQWQCSQVHAENDADQIATLDSKPVRLTFAGDSEQIKPPSAQQDLREKLNFLKIQ